MTHVSTFKIYINDLDLDSIKGEDEVEQNFVRCDPQSTWYIYEELEVSRRIP